MELSNNKKKKRTNIKITDISTNWKTIINIWIFIIIFLSSIIYYSFNIWRMSNEYEEAANIYHEKINKEYIVLNKDQIITGKHSSDLVFLLKCIDNGKEIEQPVTRSTYIKYKSGDHVWFKLERHVFDSNLDPNYKDILKKSDNKKLLLLLSIVFMSLLGMFTGSECLKYNYMLYYHSFGLRSEIKDHYDKISSLERAFRLFIIVISILYSLFTIFIA